MSQAGSVVSRRRGLWLSLALAAICVFAYDVTRLENTSGDNISSRYWPVAVMKYHTYKLNPFKTDLKDVAYTAIYYGNGDWIPRADIGMLVTGLPFYFAFEKLGLVSPEWTHDEISRTSRWIAIILVTLSVLGIFHLSRRFVPDSTAFASALLFALGTYCWSLGSQGTSTQTVGSFLHVMSFFLIWRLSAHGAAAAKGASRDAFLLGLLCGYAWTVRPSTLFMIVAPILLMRTWRMLGVYFAGISVIIGAGVLSYLAIYNDPLGWRGILTKLTTETDSTGDWLFQGLPLHGLPGILFSPNRGAIVFLPVLLLVPYLWYRLMPWFDFKAMIRSMLRYHLPVWREQSKNGLTEAFSGTLAIGAALYLAATTTVGEWHGSWGYGPRYLYDIQPYIWMPITLGLDQIRRWVMRSGEVSVSRPILVLLALFSLQGLGVHFLGHRNFDVYVWNLKAPVPPRIWNFNDFILTDTWNTRPHAERWPDQVTRFRELGY